MCADGRRHRKCPGAYQGHKGSAASAAAGDVPTAATGQEESGGPALVVGGGGSGTTACAPSAADSDSVMRGGRDLGLQLLISLPSDTSASPSTPSFTFPVPTSWSSPSSSFLCSHVFFFLASYYTTTASGLWLRNRARRAKIHSNKYGSRSPQTGGRIREFEKSRSKIRDFSAEL